MYALERRKKAFGFLTSFSGSLGGWTKYAFIKGNEAMPEHRLDCSIYYCACLYRKYRPIIMFATNHGKIIGLCMFAWRHAAISQI